MDNNKELKRSLTLFPCVMIMITSVIGSGIFTVPNEIMLAAQGSGTIFLAWILAGLCVFLMAMVYMELGPAMPQAGGSLWPKICLFLWLGQNGQRGLRHCALRHGDHELHRVFLPAFTGHLQDRRYGDHRVCGSLQHLRRQIRLWHHQWSHRGKAAWTFRCDRRRSVPAQRQPELRARRFRIRRLGRCNRCGSPCILCLWRL